MTMKYPNAHPGTEELSTCPRCGSTEVDSTRREVEFDYGGREKPFRVKATFPFITCRQCGSSFLDGDDEELQHDAACRHLGVMTPAEVRALRERMGLSQKELAELTGLGVASVSRWERGLLIQNEACDQLLYLLTFPENLERLREHKVASAANTPAPVNQKPGQAGGNGAFPTFKPRILKLDETVLAINETAGRGLLRPRARVA
jgi:putative zinc finger/helix-turn-helix YgiT family protein